MASNPRIDDLRRRLEKDPGSRLFAQLAEELRKEGELAEAIRVARDGLAKHGSYASARMTLGRALLDQGAVTAARTEFEEVLRSAPENILAGRFLGECLEALGDLPGALSRYSSTLGLSPGDATLEARRRSVEDRLAEAKRAATSAAIESQAVPVSEVDDGELELEPAGGGGLPGTAPDTESPIPVVAADEEFELEQAFEGGRWKGEAAAPAPVASEEPEEFELERPYETPRTAWSGGGVEAGEAAAPSRGEEPDLTSATLAELYFSQGFVEKALEVYRLLLARDPGNERLRARASEIENIVGRAGGSPAEQTVDDRAARRAAIERTIVRLERFLAVARRQA